MRKLFPIVVIMLVVLSLSCVLSFSASAESGVLEVESELYIGEYDSGTHSGYANIVFGVVDESASVYGVIITDSNGSSRAFAGRAKGEGGKFGVAVYEMTTGAYYTAKVYSGSYDNVTGEVGFYANEANEIVVNYNWVGHNKKTSVSVKENTVISDPDVSTLTAPKNAEFGGWYDENGKKFDFSKPVTKDVNLNIGWVANDTYDGKQFTYKKDSTSSGFRTNIGSSAPVDLSDGSSITMEMDVLSGWIGGNFQLDISAMGWLPNGISGTPYNNGFSSTGHVSFCGNSAYTSVTPSHYYGYCWSNGPSTIDKSHFEYSAPFIPGNIFVAGNTVRIVYTAPTERKTGSFAVYYKPSNAPESAYVEGPSMRGLELTDVYDTSNVWLWLGFTSTASSSSQNLTFRNYRVYKGEQSLPIMLFNHADTEITVSDVYKTDLDKAYTFTVPEASSSAYLMTKTAVNLSQGGYVAMEMDVLSENLYYKNINYGIAIWQYLGISNTYGSGFHDMFWYGNPQYKNDLDGKNMWKVEDLVDKTEPTRTPLCVEDIWTAGNSVKIVYNAPTDTNLGSIEVYTKLIQEDSNCYSLVSSVTGIKKSQVLDTSSVHFGIGLLNSQQNTSASSMKLSRVRAYSSIGDLEFVVQSAGTLVEDTAYIPEYAISFDVNGGTGKLDDVWLQKGSTLESVDFSGMTAPEGDEFECWVDEDGNPFDVTTPVTRHMHLTAKWQKDWSSAFNVSGNMITGLTSYGKTLTDITIPSYIHGIEMKAIGYGAFEGESIETVIISRSIEKIYDDAFRGATSLDTVIFDKGSKLFYIGDSVFRDCEALSNITLPDSVEEVGELAFFGADESGFDKLYSLNLKEKEYYSNKYVYEFLGEDVMPIGAYIEPSVGYFADGVTLEQVMKDFVDSGCNNLINIGQLRYGTTGEHYRQMLEYLESYGGVMMMKGGTGYASQYASYAGNHVVDEPGVVSWTPGLVVYDDDTTYKEAWMGEDHSTWKDTYTRKLYYVNLLAYTTYDEAFVYGAHHANNPTLRALNVGKTWSEYSEYADPDFYYTTYIDNVNPSVFSYDYYPLKGEFPNLAGGHFEQLYYSNYYAQLYNKAVYGEYIPFWNFVQINGWLSGTVNGVVTTRPANYNELLWQINTALAFGAKGYQYYCYNDYGDISGNGKPSNWWDTPINIDGTKNETVYNTMQNVNMQAQSMAKWLLNADFDHLAQSGTNPNGETIRSSMFAPRDTSMTWTLSSTSGINHLVSYMKYYSNNNYYDYGEEGEVQELYFVCNNDIQSSNNGNITLNFGKTVSGSYIYKGIEYTFRSSSLTVRTEAGEGFAVLLN